MNSLIVHNFKNNAIRIININGEPYFCLKNTCVILGIKNSRAALTRLDLLGSVATDPITKGGTQKLTLISVPNLNRLVLESRMPSAEAFEHWVADEVLFSLQKTASMKFNPRTDYYFL